LQITRGGAAVFVAALLALNAFTQARVVAHINRYTLTTDPIVHRFNPYADVWRRLRLAVSTPDEAPVLIAGFRNTPAPHWLALGIRPAAHVLGADILDWWRIAPGHLDPPSAAAYFAPFVTRRDRAALRDARVASPINDWPTAYAGFLARSARAIVPVGGRYPVEWGAWRSLIGPPAVRFPNMADVVARTGSSMILDSGVAVTGESDEQGPWWRSDGPIRLRPDVAGPTEGVIEVTYTGQPPAIEVADAPGALSRSEATIEGETVVRFSGTVDRTTRVTAAGALETRLRLVTFLRL
jgi:hypothetical protein